MNRSTRSILLGSTGIAVALGLAPSANAQDVLETVVVTAEKQATDIQKTAISIEAITPEMTKQSGKVRLGDILEMVPSVSVLQQGAGAARSFFIRGVGVAGAVVSLEDGIAITEGNNAAAFDTARIEVLRGPQSTLYGKGALAGMVNVITNDPTDKYEAKTSLEGGSYNHIQIEALFNVPLSDGLAIRLSGVTQQRTGAINPNKSSGDDYTALRGKLLIHPSEAFRLVLTASMAETKQPGGNDVFPYPSTKVANFASPAFGGFNPCGGNPKVNATADPWHADPFYYIPFSCTAPARPPLSSAPVTGACMGALRAETWAEQATAALEYDMGWSNLQIGRAHV